MARAKFNDFAAFKKVLDGSKNIVALSGAGISAESGIPTFRGAGGLWRNHKAAELATLSAFEANPSLVWEFYHYRRTVAFGAQPNAAHLALAKFEQDCTDGRQLHIITQNVDGLHRRAGSKNVVELHGALTKIRCTKCNHVEENNTHPIVEALRNRGDPTTREEEYKDIPLKDLPRCSKCKGLARPHIVWFGESLESNVLAKAGELIQNCDLCLVIGTSMVVYPAAGFAYIVAEAGKPVAEFNIDEEPLGDFQFYFCGPSSTTLPKALGYEDSIFLTSSQLGASTGSSSSS